MDTVKRQENNSMNEYFNKSYLESRKNEAKALIDKEVIVTLIRLPMGTFNHFCDLDNIYVFVCVQT